MDNSTKPLFALCLDPGIILYVAMFLVFHTDCETNHLSGPAGMISSPNYPNAYENNLDCHSYIYAFSGSTINITFLAFDTQTPHDWLSVRINCFVQTSATRRAEHAFLCLFPF